MMVDEAKITLSNKELELVCNTDWIFTKHTVIKKVQEVFGSVLPIMEKESSVAMDCLPTELFINRAKISRGENYQLLPYVMMDYPRYFDKNDTLAIRTLFWWGNFFSITLQLSGKFKTEFEAQIIKQFEGLKESNYWLCIHDSPWQHDFDSTNYLPVTDFTATSFSGMLHGKQFIKLAKKIPLQSWETVPSFLIKSFEEMIELVKKT